MKKILILLFLFFCGTVGGEEFTSNEITTFVSPDASYAQLKSLIDDAESSMFVNVYTFDNPYIAGDIIKAEKRGVDVVVLVDKSPVGGISDKEWTILNNLSGSRVPVYLWQNPDLGFNHAKYIVVDNSTVLVSTENLGDTGFPMGGATGNRGWGAIVSGPLASYFSELFLDDVKSGMELNFSGFSPLVFYPEGRDRGVQFEPREFKGNYIVSPVVAPNDAVETILNLIDSANSSLYIEEFYVYRYWGSKRGGYGPNPFLESAIDAARRGVEVKILLDSTWYNIEEDDPRSNLKTIEYVNKISEDEHINLEAKLVDLKEHGFKKLHVKGMVVDGKAALVSSINWNEYSPTKNREVGVVIYGEPAKYFSDVFISDWGAEKDEDNFMNLLLVPIGLVIALILLKRRKMSW
ncbi:MAG: phospholipase D-like domain-containing protein [Candidatus Hydrothermarchaeaceae archaeon]